MPDYIAGCDISHYQSRPNFDQLVEDGIKFIGIKATQGMSVDPDFDWATAQAVQRNMPFFCYPFIEPTDTDAAREHFVSLVGKGGHALIDAEVTLTSADVEAWIDACDGSGIAACVYRGKWPSFPITTKIAAKPWWYAQYPGSPTAAPRVPLWTGAGTPDFLSEALIWQWTGTGRIPGVSTDMDLDRIACPWEVFQGWYETGIFKGLDQPKGTPGALPQLHATPAQITRTLFLGCSGGDVTKLQERLTGYVAVPLVLDGEYGPATAAAVKDAQGKLDLDTDGIAGILTLRALGLA